MTLSKLSKSNFQLLKKIRQQGIVFVTEEMKIQCDFLEKNGYVQVFKVMVVEDFDKENGELRTTEAKIIVQITPDGRNYVDLHTSWIKKVRWEFVISSVAIIVSLVSVIIDILNIW